MTNPAIQFRADSMLQDKASNICAQLGTDLPTYLKICMTRLVEENGFPFSMNLNAANIQKGKRAIAQIQSKSHELKLDELSLDEINAEIDAVRKAE